MGQDLLPRLTLKKKEAPQQSRASSVLILVLS